jgi:hypothetical protein
MPSRRSASRGIAAALALAALATLAAPAVADADAETTTNAAVESRVTAVVSAWRKKDPEAVVQQIDPAEKATVSLTLLDEPVVSGSFGRAQAKQTLKAYFERLKGSVELKDVTTPESKRAVPGTRIFDYTYRREGRDAVTTRLEVTVKQVAGAWVLASAGERPRPRPSDGK